MVTPRLHACGLALGYGNGADVLRGIDLVLRGGKVTALVGCNGSGKSTLLRACAGLLAPRAGTVQLEGEDLFALPPRARARRLAFVPQALEMIPHLTATQFVLGGRYAHLGFFRTVTPTDHDAVRAALAHTDCAAHADRRLAELSGGERQRVLVARALAQEASVLLCDEPTAALDLQHQLELLDLLRSLADGDRAIAIATHDLNLASQYADEVVVLHEGTVHAQGPPAEVLVPSVLVAVYGARVAVVGEFAPGKPILIAQRALARE